VRHDEVYHPHQPRSGRNIPQEVVSGSGKPVVITAPTRAASLRKTPFSAAARLAGSDIVARIVAQWLTESLRPPFIVENRAGAAGNIAARAVIGSQPNGYRPLWLRPQAP